MKTNSIISFSNFIYSDKTYLIRVFGWMGIGLSITSLISFLIYYTPMLREFLLNENGFTFLGFITLFLPFAFLILLFKRLQKISYLSLIACFLFYSLIMGISQGEIFLEYSNESIYSTYNVVALMFGAMGVIGYASKSKQRKITHFFMMLFTGLILALIITIFMHSDSISLLLSFICVMAFCALTVWTFQNLERLSKETSDNSELDSKIAIIGALTLYLNYINLFLFVRKIFKI